MDIAVGLDLLWTLNKFTPRVHTNLQTCLSCREPVRCSLWGCPQPLLVAIRGSPFSIGIPEEIGPRQGLGWGGVGLRIASQFPRYVRARSVSIGACLLKGFSGLGLFGFRVNHFWLLMVVGFGLPPPPPLVCVCLHCLCYNCT